MSDYGKITWDKYYHEICNVVSKNSKCFSRNVGSIIVMDKSIISTGYNGPPRGVKPCNQRIWLDKNIMKIFFEKFGEITYEKIIEIEKSNGKCPRRWLDFKSGEGLEWCVAGHGERNSIVQAAREGIKVKGTTMFMNCNVPCSQCLVEIINSGIREIVVEDFSFYDVSSEYLINESDLQVRKYLFNLNEGELIYFEKKGD